MRWEVHTATIHKAQEHDIPVPFISITSTELFSCERKPSVAATFSSL